jgi:hypothetical protein
LYYLNIARMQCIYNCFQVNLEACQSFSLSKLIFIVAYYDENQTYPKTIVLFRDGVGDGQLETVIKHECIHLKQSFKQIKGNH